MKYATFFISFLFMPMLTYGMEAAEGDISLRDLEEGTRREGVRDPKFLKEVACLKKMGLISDR